MPDLARWLPRSLFGRLMLVLASGLLLAQLLSAAINLAERDRLLLTASGRQQAQRIADVVKLLDTSAPTERERIVAELDALRPLRRCAAARERWPDRVGNREVHDHHRAAENQVEMRGDP